MTDMPDDAEPRDLSDHGILQDALAWAARTGDTSPTAVRYVRTTREAAERLFSGPGNAWAIRPR